MSHTHKCQLGNNVVDQLAQRHIVGVSVVNIFNIVNIINIEHELATADAVLVRQHRVRGGERLIGPPVQL
jgi:hypothetical protein